MSKVKLLMARLSFITALILLCVTFPPATEAVRLYLVRHGDPEYIDLVAGLTEHGRAEAKALASYIPSLGITHAYTSPMQRAKLTAELALANTPKFSSYNKNNFAENVGIEDWCAEKQTWQASDSKLAQKLLAGTVIWDLPAPMVRYQLADIKNGTSMTLDGWVHAAQAHGQWIDAYAEFCNDADEFLTRHGIVRETDGPNYRMSAEDAANSDKRDAQIVIFGHGGTFLILLSHLLHIPLPMVTASMWLPPSSVTTILFEEYIGEEAGPVSADCRLSNGEEEQGDANKYMYCNSNSTLDGSVVMAPRAIGIGGVSHLARAGMEIAISKYEKGKRPSGLKHNYW